MKFKMLLWYMARRMELLSRTHPEFIAKLHGRDFVIQVATDEGAHRFFRIQHNRVTSRNTLHVKPDLHLQFASDDIAFRLLTSANASHFTLGRQLCTDFSAPRTVDLDFDVRSFLHESVGKLRRQLLGYRRVQQDSVRSLGVDQSLP